jgi:hypothetical protein
MNPEPINEAIKVVSGNPSAEELAAVIAILEAAHAEQLIEGKKELKRPTSAWGRNSSMLRADLKPGFGQWRAQFRPGMD